MSTNPRQAMNQRTLLGVQASANTPVSATKRLPMTSFTFTPVMDFQQHRPKGERYHSHSHVINDMTEIKAQGPGDYNDITYFLASMFNYAAPSGTDEKTWTFESNLACKDSSKMFSVWDGDSCVRGDFTHDAQVQSISLSFGADGITKDVTLLARKFETGVSQVDLAITGSPTGGTFTITYNSHTTTDLTYDDTAADIQAALVALADFSSGDIECVGGDLPSSTVTIFFKNNDTIDAADLSTTDSLTGGTSPASAFADPTQTEIAIEQMERGDVDIYFADTQATLDAAENAVRNLSATFNYNGKIAPLNVLDSDYGTEPKEWIEAPADIGLSFQVASDSEGGAFFSTCRDGDIKFMRIEVTGPVIGTDMGGTSTANYKFTGDFAFMISAAPSVEEAQNLRVNNWQGVIVDDDTWSKGCLITLVNALSAL